MSPVGARGMRQIPRDNPTAGPPCRIVTRSGITVVSTVPVTELEGKSLKVFAISKTYLVPTSRTAESGFQGSIMGRFVRGIGRIAAMRR